MQNYENPDEIGNQAPSPEHSRESLLRLSQEQLVEMVLNVTALASKTEAENQMHYRQLADLERQKVLAEVKASNLTLALTLFHGAKRTRRILKDLSPVIKHQTATILEFGINEKGGLL